MPSSLIKKYFRLEESGTTVSREVLAGVTTFLTMSYIIFVNPSILGEAGMPVAAVTAATCFAAAFGSILMGLYARYPIALAPGMGINAYFTYSVVLGMGIPWQTALGAVFISGVVFLSLTLFGVRQKLLEALPPALHGATTAGIGLFIALIGLRNTGIVVANEATLVGLGDLSSPTALLALLGLFAIAVMIGRGVHAAMLLGILGTAAGAFLLGVAEWTPGTFSAKGATQAAFELDIPAALELGLLEIVFVFLFVDLFDTLGTVVGICKKANLFDDNNRIPRIERILAADAAATVVGSLSGTSTVVSYIESAAGVAVGGRSGLTAVVTGLLFGVALFLAPFLGALPIVATAPVLIVVGTLMIPTIREVDWDDISVALPSFLTMVAIPLTYSIANGLALGFIAYDTLQIAKGNAHKTPLLVHILALVFVIRFAYLGTT